MSSVAIELAHRHHNQEPNITFLNVPIKSCVVDEDRESAAVGVESSGRERRGHASLGGASGNKRR
jgi:hypothetical protein